MHHLLIQTFSYSGQLSAAEFYLDCLTNKEIIQKSNMNLSTSKKTLESFLQGLIDHGETLYIPKSLSTALRYMKCGNIIPNGIVINQLMELFKLIDCSIETVLLSESCVCSNCKKSLLENNYNKDASILPLICDKIKEELIENGAYSFLETVKLKSKSNNQVYVLDVANVLYGHSKNHHKPNVIRLKNIMTSIIDKNKKNDLQFLLVLPRGGTNKKFNLLKIARKVQQDFIMTCNVDIISNQKIEDDLLVLYLAATNPCEILIISNDYYHEHLHLVPENRRREMLSWLQSVVKKYDNVGNVDLSPHLLPVVRHGVERLHILTENKSILLCINSSNIYKPTNINT